MKETKIEKLILDLSNRWDCSPQEAVDRLNSMNESEINKLINSMTKKLQTGGIAERPYANYTDNQLDSIARVWTKGLQETEGNLDDVLTMRDNWLYEKVSRDKKKAEEEKTKKLQEEAAKWNSHLYKFWTNPQSNAQIQMPAPLYKNGGMIDCLRNGGNFSECKKCGGKTPIKADNGDKLPYYRTSKVEHIFGDLSQNPKYPRKDGVEGYFSGEILPSGDTLTVAEGPYTKYEEIRPANGNGRFFNVYRKNTSDRFYDPGRKDKGWFRTKASEELIEMFNNIRNRFEGSPDKKKCGGSLPSKKKNYLKK